MRMRDKTSTPKAVRMAPVRIPPVRIAPVREVAGAVVAIRADKTVEGGRGVRINMADLWRGLANNDLGWWTARSGG